MAEIKTVHFNTNPRYYQLLSEFYKQTNCPTLVNTSFNVRGEPVCLHACRRLKMLFENGYGHSCNGEFCTIQITATKI